MNKRKRYRKSYQIVTIGSRFATTAVDPTTEPVSLAEVRAYARIDYTEDDYLIENILIPAGRKALEKRLASAIGVQTKQVDLDGWIQRVALPIPPWISIDSVQYYTPDSPEVLTVLPANRYRFDTATGELHFHGNLPATASRDDAVQIRWIAGEATTPEAIKAAMLLIVGDLYENREAQVIGQGLVRIKNPTVDWLTDNYRSYR